MLESMLRFVPLLCVVLLAGACEDIPDDCIDCLPDDDDTVQFDDDDTVIADDDDSSVDDDDSTGDDDDSTGDDDDSTAIDDDDSTAIDDDDSSVADDDDSSSQGDDDDSGAGDDDDSASVDCTGPAVVWSGDVVVGDPSYAVEDVCGGGYTHVTGDVSLSLWAGTSLSALDCLCTIDGDLTLFNTALGDGDGLANLELVGGSVTISGNPALGDLDGFDALTAVGVDLTISNNVALQSLGFASLSAVGGNLTIAWNASLPTAEANALQDSIGPGNIGGSVTIMGNAP